MLVPPLHREVEIELAERGEKRVRVADGERAAVRVLDLELVVERQPRLGQQRLPEAGGILELRFDPGGLDAHRMRLGSKGAYDDTVLGLVRAEHAVRVRAEIYGHNASAACCMRRSIPATGIPTQSGRFATGESMFPPSARRGRKRPITRLPPPAA